MSGGVKDKLLKFLRECKISNNRAVFADLRCALRDNLKHRAWPYLARFGGIGEHQKEYDHYAKVVQVVAGLFATHSKESPGIDFGSACRGLMRDEEQKKLYDSKEVGPLGRRFQYLLSSEKEEICDRVIRFVIYMKANNIPVNYDELFDGLLFWGDKIKTRWAGSFWKASHVEEVIE